MKFAVRIREIRTRTVIVDNCETIGKAVNEVMTSYNKGDIILDENNSISEVECCGDTKQYIDIFGVEEFNSIKPDLIVKGE